MIKSLINIVAIASRKGGRVNKQSIILGLVHMLNPLTNVLILLILSAVCSKVSTKLFLVVSMVFHLLVIIMMNWKFSDIEKMVNKEKLKGVSSIKHEMYAVIYLVLVLIVGFMAMFMALFVSEIVEKIQLLMRDLL